MAALPPAEATSLLVPVHLDALVVDSAFNAAAVLQTYRADYSKLESLEGPILADDTLPLALGIHLRWALPDALTHGRRAGPSAPVEFPLVPNRWLVARFDVSAAGAWEANAWVVESDHLGTSEAPGTSAFLDPTAASGMKASTNTAPSFVVNEVAIGTSHPVADWEKAPGGATAPYLTATGPANLSFAAYAGFSENVFSFVDPAAGLPAEGKYTYMVVGWYSDPAAADPLRGVAAYVPGTLWPDESSWQAETPQTRFAAILADLAWSVQGDPPADPPSTSLCHGTVAQVQWPPGDQADPTPDPGPLTVAFGNTSTDALAALIKAYANAQAAKGDASDWTAAGNELADLVEAAMLDALDTYGTPGGPVLLKQAIEKSWFGSSPGGTVWETVSRTPAAAGDTGDPPQLTAAQSAAVAAKLAALNTSQRDLDEQQRRLASMQETLYGMWLRVAWANLPQHTGWNAPQGTTPAWVDLDAFFQGTVYPKLFDDVWDCVCATAATAAALPDPTDGTRATEWADSHWSLPAADGHTTLSGLGLALKPVPEPPFWHPTDPVLMVAGANRSLQHGHDGRLNEDGTLTCRVPGQIIEGVQITNQPAVTAAAMRNGGVKLDPLSQYTQIPAVPGLTQEAFLVDPGNAGSMVHVAGGDPNTVATGIRDLLSGDAKAGVWQGSPPALFAIAAWKQPWIPLFLEWTAHFYPTGSGSGMARPFDPADWLFDGQSLVWQGTGVDQNDAVAYSGRTVLTPQAPLLFQSKIVEYLGKPSSDKPRHMDELIEAVGGWDIVSQTLGGITDQMITLLSQEIFPPDATGGTGVTCPRPASGGTQPSPAALIGGQYRYLPRLSGTRKSGDNKVSDFYPLRAGFLDFVPWSSGNPIELAVVDAFGQRFPLAGATGPQGFAPVIAQGLVPDKPPLRAEMIQLPPRIVQGARLDFRFLSSDGSGHDIATAADPNPICGWLLPNHLDGGIAVYDGGGTMLGELIALPALDNWRPRPGDPGKNPPPSEPSKIANGVLREVVMSLASQTPDVFGDVLTAIDETLWMVDPLGGREDQSLSAMFGRPLAVVQASVGLSLKGEPVTDQAWDALVANPEATPADFVWNRDPGDVVKVEFPVRLGNLDLRADGLIGYYLPDEKYGKFHTVHVPEASSSTDAYLCQIAKPPAGGKPGVYQGELAVNATAPAKTITLVLDPRGPVHAFTGILPVTSSALPPYLVEQFVKQLAVTFRTGPVLTDPGTLRMPLPGRRVGAWDWVQATPVGWEEDEVVGADDVARLPDTQLQLREGWLRLSEVDDS